MSRLQKKTVRAAKSARGNVGAIGSGRQEALLRIGIGNDVHELVGGKRLILGGVNVPSKTGPRAHSDGDALVHAICDALLGAAGLGDIGGQFPDTSPRWRNASSLRFLREIRRKLDTKGYIILNVDATVGLEWPKLMPHIPRMRRNVARSLGVKSRQVSVKAKTGEGMDAVGRGEAVRADAVALIRKIS